MAQFLTSLFVALSMFVALAVVPAAQAQGVPGIDANKCLAGKNKCVSKKIAGLMKCRAKCQKKPDKCGQALTDCETKVMTKFDGGTNPAKGCFEKLEGKADAMKPESVCTTTGDTASMEAEVDAAVDELLGRLEGTPAPSCGDGVVNAAGEQCDGADLDGYTCATLGHPFGALGCDGSCDFDVNGCSCVGLGGVEVGGACWFNSAVDGNCTDACAAVGLNYDDATRDYAGSAGTNANCVAVNDALGNAGGAVLDFVCAAGFSTGCTWSAAFGAPFDRIRCVSPAPTTAGADAGPDYRRVCACS